MRRLPSAARDWPSTRHSTCRCTRPKSSPRRSASAWFAPKTHSRDRRRSWKSAPPTGSADDGLETILLDVDEASHVATITLNRPDSLNAFNRTMCEEMAQAWRIVKLDDSVSAVVLRAAGDRAFSAGLDIKSS